MMTEDLTTDCMMIICMIMTGDSTDATIGDSTDVMTEDIIDIRTATDPEDAKIQYGGCSGHFSSFRQVDINRVGAK